MHNSRNINNDEYIVARMSLRCKEKIPHLFADFAILSSIYCEK